MHPHSSPFALVETTSSWSELGHSLKSKLSPRQCVHQNSACAAALTWTLNRHLGAIWQEAAQGCSPVLVQAAWGAAWTCWGRVCAHRDHTGHTQSSCPDCKPLQLEFKGLIVIYHLQKHEVFYISYVSRHINACA